MFRRVKGGKILLRTQTTAWRRIYYHPKHHKYHISTEFVTFRPYWGVFLCEKIGILAFFEPEIANWSCENHGERCSMGSRVKGDTHIRQPCNTTHSIKGAGTQTTHWRTCWVYFGATFFVAKGTSQICWWKLCERWPFAMVHAKGPAKGVRKVCERCAKGVRKVPFAHLSQDLSHEKTFRTPFAWTFRIPFAQEIWKSTLFRISGVKPTLNDGIMAQKHLETLNMM